jgi:hypothetical protein
MRHLLWRGEVKSGVRTPLLMGAIEGAVVADRDEDILQAMPLSEVIMHIPGGDDGDLQPICEAGEPTHPIPVPQDPIVLKLHEDPLGAKGAQKTAEKGLPRSLRIFERAKEWRTSASGQKDEAIVPLEE